MRKFGQGLVVLAIIAVVLATLLALGIRKRGYIKFHQTVILEAGKPIRRVTFCNEIVDDDTRRRVESTADLALFDCWEAERIVANRFRTRVAGASTESLLYTKTFIYPHLVIYVEFEDGTLVARVVDVPPGRGEIAIMIRLP